MKPRLLDLFCGAGGCAVGYDRAGFEVVGVDSKPQPNYPFAFVQMDAIEALEYVRRTGWFIECATDERIWFGKDFAAIHASPPCQRYSVGRHIHQSGNNHPDLVDPVRKLLQEIGKPWVIENVMGSPLERAIVLCGLMFDLKVLRHRAFESSHVLLQPPHPKHPKGNLTNSCQGYSTGQTGYVCVAGHNFVRTAAAQAMGIDWMKNRHELAQAIPPAYTEFIGKQLMNALTEDACPLFAESK